MVFLQVPDPEAEYERLKLLKIEREPKLETLRRSEFHTFSISAQNGQEFIISYSNR
jgi:hypothetical protein